jgi:Ser/Thr protein kinase RdoA (MazF antagonist)
MTTRVEACDLRASLEARDEPGAAELTVALEALLGRPESGWAAGLIPLKRRVYRLRLRPGYRAHSLIVKRSEPPIAQLNRMVAERWLPALGLADHCAALLATAPDREGRWFWQVYDDLGDETLARDPDRERVAATIDLIASLHVRGTGHALLPEVRQFSKDLGLAFFSANVTDAIRGLERLDCDPGSTPELQALRDRLLARLYPLVTDTPRRAAVFAEAGGPDTLLHGDLWRDNAFATITVEGVRVRLIDWDHVGVGPLAYDLSTFLMRFPFAERSWILDRYRQALSLAGRSLPAARALNTLFETAEYARFANRVSWAAMAWRHENAEWVPIELAEIERWFTAWCPILDEA